MIQKSVLYENEEPEAFLKTCRATEIIPNVVVECLVPKQDCNSFLHYGTKVFCTHPLKNEIVKRTDEEK